MDVQVQGETGQGSTGSSERNRFCVGFSRGAHGHGVSVGVRAGALPADQLKHNGDGEIGTRDRQMHRFSPGGWYMITMLICGTSRLGMYDNVW